MTTKDEALQMALEALTCIDDGGYDRGHRCGQCDDYVDRNSHVRAACRAALAQKDEQEPVAWCHLSYNDDGSSIPDSLQHCPDSYCTTPLYTAPPKRKPLNGERLKVKMGGWFGTYLSGHWFYLIPADEYAEAALTKHTGIGEQK